MMRWWDARMKPPPRLHRKAAASSNGSGAAEVTDDPLAALQIIGSGQGRSEQQVYAVSRSVFLPRVQLNRSGTEGGEKGGGVNPLYQLEDPPPSLATISTKNKPNKNKKSSSTSKNTITTTIQQHHHPPAEKSRSSGYGSSSLNESNNYLDHLKLLEETNLLEQNPAFVKSIRVAGRGVRSSKKSSIPSQNSTSLSSGTLTTIPEGRVDGLIPQPIWPSLEDRTKHYDSLVDDALLLYTSLSYVPTTSDKDKNKCLESYVDLSVKDLLLDLITNINQMLEENKSSGSRSSEDMLKVVNEKIKSKLEALKNSTEEEVKKLCVNLSNSKKMNCVLRAMSNSNSSSGNSSQSSSGRARTSSSETEDLYQIPSGSSSSGFSDHPTTNVLPIYVHEDLVTVPNGMRNALIYGTLSRSKNNQNNNIKTNSNTHSTSGNNSNINNFGSNNSNVSNFGNKSSDKLDSSDGGDEKVLLSGKSAGGKKTATLPKKQSLLRAVNDNKPSVWEQYYGVRAVLEVDLGKEYVGKPSDVPLFPGGRPEADFTLDVPRSELLSKRLREDKKWRCRCRLLTSFLGLVFFLLSVMAVSLMLTRGKKMFGSMV